MRLKFAITGTHGSGKTTTLNHVVKTLRNTRLPFTLEPDFGKLEEAARLCPYPLGPSKGTFRAQLWILRHQIHAEKNTENRALSIFDQSVPGQLAYVEALTCRGRIKRREAELLERMATSWVERKPYTIIFWLSSLGETGLREKDPLRCNDPSYQREIDRRLEEIYALPKLKRRTLYVEPTSLSERVETIVKHILDEWGWGGRSLRRVYDLLEV